MNASTGTGTGTGTGEDRHDGLIIGTDTTTNEPVAVDWRAIKVPAGHLDPLIFSRYGRELHPSDLVLGRPRRGTSNRSEQP